MYKNDTELNCLFADRITRMVIGQHIDVIDFKPFPNLRSLVIHGAGYHQLEQIKSDLLPNLVYLYISFCGPSPAFIRLVQGAFSGMFACLRVVEFNCIDLTHNNPWLISVSLRSVSLHGGYPLIIPMILTSCPHLSYLQVHVTKLGNYATLSSKSNSHPLKTLALMDEHNQMPFETIDHLLLYTPNITCLSLQYFSIEPLTRLARSLSKHVKQLRQFHCNITQPMDDDTIVTEGSVRKLHPCFNQIHIRTKKYVYRVYTTSLRGEL